MKKLSILIISSIFSLSVCGGNGPGDPEYCAKMRDGKKVVMHEGTVLTSETTLKNGAKLKTDGTIVKSDGKKETLKEGECISKDGSVEKKEAENKDGVRDKDLDRDKDKDLDRDKSNDPEKDKNMDKEMDGDKKVYPDNSESPE